MSVLLVAVASDKRLVAVPNLRRDVYRISVPLHLRAVVTTRYLAVAHANG